LSDLEFKMLHRIHGIRACVNACGEITIRHTNACRAVLET
jgi:hypothetical protein